MPVLKVFSHVSVVVAVIGLSVAATSASAQQAPGTLPQIRANSALLSIDPKHVEGGKLRIAKMDAARITTTSGGEQEFPAFHVIGNTYYVGTRAYTALIVKTSDGLILIDTTFPSTAPWVVKNIESLGFKLSDIRIILGSHAHADHEGGLAYVKARTPNAKLWIMDADVPVVEKGTPARPGSTTGDTPPVKVDKVLHDGEKIRLGDVVITAWKTAGHTQGATSYEWKTTEGGKSYTFVFVGSQQVAEKLIPEGYPGIVGDQILTWTRLLSLRADAWMGGHTWQHDQLDKYEELTNNPSGPNPFIDPAGYRELISARAYEFVQSLNAQRATAEQAAATR